MPDFSAVNVTETELEKEILKINYIGTQNGTRSVELGVTYQQLKKAIADNKIIKDTYGTIYSARGTDTLELKKVEVNGSLLNYAVLSIPPYSGTTASVTSKESILTPNIQLPVAFLEGDLNETNESISYGDLITALGVFGIACDSDGIIYNAKVTGGGRGNTVLSAVKDANTYVSYTIGMSDNGGLKLTARTVIPNTGIFALPIGARDMADEAKAVDIGIPLDDLADLIENGVIRAVSATDGSILTASASTVSGARRVVLKLVTTTPFISNGNVFIECGIGFHLTDARSGKVDITKIADLAKAPCVDETGKLPAEVLPEQEPHVEFSLQLHNGDLLMICKEGEILPTDEIHFYRRGRYSTHLHSDISSRYRNRKDGWRTSNNYSGWVDIDQGYETYIPYQFDKEKLEQGVNGNPKLVDMDVWKLTAIEDQSGFADPFPALFRSAMVRLRYPNEKDSWDVCIRDGRDGKKYGWEDFQKLSQTGEIRKTVQAGVAVHRNIRRISDIVPFKIRFHLINDGTLSAEISPTIDDNYVRVTLRI